ncbi:facilitated trehalose transporter Tret1-like [Sitodiplosis mosellana]|uniref:facilitated trehalose transporter Tret1-like n=1 Tax=Sitodiplosis mosellana TaxID=263140 RepID=UPI002444CA2D|nr:facilitated trehalose transporter Tret1-like [Sitodiplosis mosellana]
MDSGANSEEKDQNAKKCGAFQRFLSQFLATTIESVLLIGCGFCMVFASIIIPALTGIPNKHNLNESLSLTPSQASWLGSVGFICAPIGSILSTFLADPLGPKRTMMIVNLVLAIGWFIMQQASSVSQIFVAAILIGLGLGLMVSPVVRYVGEICEPAYRGVLIAYVNVSVTIGMLLVFVLNTLMSWRTVALVSLCLPILTTIALIFVPESPLWLLSKNRISDAFSALCWLRGWVETQKAQEVAEEFEALQNYSKRSRSCNDCIKRDLNCTHPLPTIVEKLKELKRKQVLKPLFIVFSMFIIAEFSGMTGMTPFIVRIFVAYDSPISPDRAAAIQSFVNTAANILVLFLIKFTGKRKLYIFVLLVAFLCTGIISIYGFIILPNDYNSFDLSKLFSPENKQLAFIPFVCLIVWGFCAGCGVNSMPWQFVSEVYPSKARGAAVSLSAAFDYLLYFVSTKSYYNLETSLSMPGVALFNCIIIGCGLILMYNILPETENRTLEDIELHFSDNSKKLTDRKIAQTRSASEERL